MKDSVLIEVSEILNAFNISEITKLIEEQINDDYSEDNSTDIMVDHLKPLYYTYANMTKYKLDEDTKREAENRFYAICKVFIDAICKKFKLVIDEEWLNDNPSTLIALTFTLYSFFVLEFSANVNEVLLNYILQNTSEIYEVFEGMRNKKDSSTIANKKTMSPEMALIISNIYDISSWIFNKMTEAEFFNYLNDDYLPLQLIETLFDDGKISGEFMEAINEIFKANIRLKSKTCFTIIYKFRNEELKDPLFKSSNENK